MEILSIFNMCSASLLFINVYILSIEYLLKFTEFQNLITFINSSILKHTQINYVMNYVMNYVINPFTVRYPFSDWLSII